MIAAAPKSKYWDERLETLPSEERDALVLAKIQKTMRWAYERSPFYRKRWAGAGIEPGDIRSLADFERVPTIAKADLRADQAENPPFGSYLCVDVSDVKRIHGTSGTSGRPTAFAWTRRDMDAIAEDHARIMWSFGLRPNDCVFVGSILSLYVGSWGALMGAERLGATVFPFGAGVKGQTQQALSWIDQMRPTAFYGTPSYALRLAETARTIGYDPRKLGFRIMFFSGEPGAGIPATKNLIQETFGASCIDSGSMGEMTPWMNLCECSERTGMHLWQDIVYTELLDPVTWRRVPFGERGTPVYTSLDRECQPMIRLVSGDFAEWTDAPCPCGRTYPRFPGGVIGRIDDMLVIRGENVYPSAIEEAIRAFVGELAGEFEIVVRKERHMDELIVRLEHAGDASGAYAERLSSAVRAKVGVRPAIEFCDPGSLERTDLKSRRVRDER
ncbi:MAG TPA: AMP-binding protein [Candidatus Acidoferrales bacterium]|nr:AMP-binding protein [Candidatus Acidoferrales bacterium]